MKWIRLVLIMILMVGIPWASARETHTYRTWIEQMKQAPRGPFVRLRWFCNDGSILEPKAYACQEHGGGVQHGQWSEKTKILRSKGYMIANVYADVKADAFVGSPDHIDVLKQMILEQFLIQADEGWIFSKARYYRGALQTEDEALGGEALLLGLLENPRLTSDHFLLMREAVRTLPHYHKNAPISQMRQLSLTLAQADENFERFRVKIHVKPEQSDAAAVREYAKKQGRDDLKAAYENLALLIEQVFLPGDLTQHILSLADLVSDPEITTFLQAHAQKLTQQTDPFARFEIISQISQFLRKNFVVIKSKKAQLSALDTGILLEDELFSLSASLLGAIPTASVGQSLEFLSWNTDALYGTGLISRRQYMALKEVFEKLKLPGRDQLGFRSDLMYASSASDWTERNLQFHFSETVEHFMAIEPLSARYVHDRLHSSLMLSYSHVLDHLMADNSRQLGISHDIWGRQQTHGINGLNPGLARGVLRYPAKGEKLEDLPVNSIVVLPATTSELPPVAGIITAGKGNILSHVQLLARNLGIPNVAVDSTLLDQVRSRKDRQVVLAVSPGGLVRIQEYHSDWDQVFAQKKKEKRRVLRADTGKLELKDNGFISLDNIRAKDSGRLAGPKAANLGELKYHFPDAVTDGVIIPFSVFSAFLEQPFQAGGTRMFEWMKNQYAVIDALTEKPEEQKAVINSTLSQIRSWILATDPGEKFKADLAHIMEKTLGPDRSYGVFVRSDTNVEDLPGFTGAGLNLTVPHVIGFENIFNAVKRVWASPFTQRSFGWRHAFLENPEHVYASVLLMKTVPVEKSGVMVTKDLRSGNTDWLTVAVNEGVGGAVSGQTAEELKIHKDSGRVVVLSQATEPKKRVVLDTGGMDKISASGKDAVLSAQDIVRLTEFARKLPDRFPVLRDDQGRAVPADVEFGFLKGELVLFQIRPFLDDFKSNNNQYLNGMDEKLKTTIKKLVDLERVPGREPS